jgi:ssDNA-binding Zn-finger/Zn-ribbon topoisomerase 1
MSVAIKMTDEQFGAMRNMVDNTFHDERKDFQCNWDIEFGDNPDIESMKKQIDEHEDSDEMKYHNFYGMLLLSQIIDKVEAENRQKKEQGEDDDETFTCPNCDKVLVGDDANYERVWISTADDDDDDPDDDDGYDVCMKCEDECNKKEQEEKQVKQLENISRKRKFNP